MGFFGAVLKTAAGVVNAVEDAVDAVADAVTDDARSTADAADEGAREVAGAVAVLLGTTVREGARAAEKATDTLQRIVDELARDVRGFRESTGAAAHTEPPEIYRERTLTKQEEALACSVFGATSLPYGSIYLSNGLGFERRPYAIPHPAEIGGFVIHIGPVGFVDATSSTDMILAIPVDDVFIHELVHVWQGYNYGTPFAYVVDSVLSQFFHDLRGTNAYTAVPGSEWWEYNVEQQAALVQEWYARGLVQADTDPRWRYVRDHIRPGEP